MILIIIATVLVNLSNGQNCRGIGIICNNYRPCCANTTCELIPGVYMNDVATSWCVPNENNCNGHSDCTTHDLMCLFKLGKCGTCKNNNEFCFKNSDCCSENCNNRRCKPLQQYLETPQAFECTMDSNCDSSKRCVNNTCVSCVQRDKSCVNNPCCNPADECIPNFNTHFFGYSLNDKSCRAPCSNNRNCLSGKNLTCVNNRCNNCGKPNDICIVGWVGNCCSGICNPANNRCV